MSLLDALLLEPTPLKTPDGDDSFRESVHVALRTDGILGSGTASDPYDGSTRRGPLVSISTLNLGDVLSVTTFDWATEFDVELEWSGGMSKDVTVTMEGSPAPPHGYAIGIKVTISGVEGTDASKYNGDFDVTAVPDTTSFVYSLASLPTDQPPGASIKCKAKRIVTIVTVSAGLAYEAGDYVVIANVGGASAAIYNGRLPIKAMISSTKFTCELPSEPTNAPTGAGITCKASLGVATTTGAHGLAINDLVEIDGVTGDSEDYCNWIFPVKNVLSSTSFKFDIASAPAEAAGSITCQKVAYRLDPVLEDLPARSAAFLGEGVFETRGFNVFSTELRAVKDGQRIIGSGIDATTLKVIVTGIPIPHPNYCAMGSAFLGEVDVFEVADLTIDCNLAGHPYGKPYSTLAKSAVLVTGRDVRIRRIRAIDYGTQSVGSECFVIMSGCANPSVDSANCVIDDCLMELPSPDNVRETTCMGFFTHSGALPRGCAIRNCVLDGRYSGNKTSRLITIEEISPFADHSATHFTLTTAEPHGRSVGQNVKISGIMVWKPALGRLDSSAFLNGMFIISAASETTFEIDLTNPIDNTEEISDDERINLSSATIGAIFQGPHGNGGTGVVVESNRVYHLLRAGYNDTWSTRDVIFRNNYWCDVENGNLQFMGQEFPLQGELATPCALSNSSNIATVTIAGGHRFLPGQLIHVENARHAVPGGSVEITDFKGYWEIIEVPASPTNAGNGLPQTLKYQMKTAPTLSVDNNGSETPPGPPVFREFFSARQVVVERNVIELARSLRPNLASSCGISLTGALDDRPNNFRRAILRENMIRQFAPEPDDRSAGLLLASCDQGVVQNNVFDLGCVDNRLAQDYRVGRVGYLNNQRVSGATARGWDALEQRTRDDLRRRIEDASIMGI